MQLVCLEADGLSVAFSSPASGEVDLFSDLSFSCPAGAITAIVGPSGSGKTTLLDCIMGTVRYRGSIRFFDDDVPVAGFRPRISRSFQATRLVSYLTVQENLDFTNCLSGDSEGRADSTGDSPLAELGLGSLADRYPANLSGGELARVGLVRALMANPEVLLVDEPTASLDRRSVLPVVELLERLVETRGVSIVVATHDPVVESMAAQVVDLYRDG